MAGSTHINSLVLFICGSNIYLFLKLGNRRFQEEELNRYEVDFANSPFLAKITYPPSLFNQDFLSLVGRVESQYNFLCHTVGMSWRKSKSKEVVLWESLEIR